MKFSLFLAKLDFIYNKLIHYKFCFAPTNGYVYIHIRRIFKNPNSYMQHIHPMCLRNKVRMIWYAQKFVIFSKLNWIRFHSKKIPMNQLFKRFNFLSFVVMTSWKRHLEMVNKTTLQGISTSLYKSLVKSV